MCTIWLLLLFGWVTSAVAAEWDGAWRLQVERVQSGDLRLEALQGQLEIDGETGSWALQRSAARLYQGSEAFGRIEFDGRPADSGLAGGLRWLAGEGLRLSGDWSLAADGAIAAALEQGRIRVQGHLDDLRLQLRELPLAPWRRWLGSRLGLTPARLEAALSADLRWHGEQLSGSAHLQGAGFDTADGLRAAAGISARLQIDPAASWPWQLTADAGELLWDEFYFALPASGLRLQLAPADAGWRLAASEDGVFELSGALQDAEGPWGLDLQVADLQRWHERYLAGYLQARAWSAVLPVGRFSARVSGRGVEPTSVTLNGRLERLELAGMEVLGLDLDAAWQQAGQGHAQVRAEASRWGELSLSGWQLQARQSGDHWILQAPLQLSLLGGQATLGSLDVDLGQRPWQARAGLSLREIDVAGLMQALAWTPLPGRLSAEFPSVLLEPQRVELQGGADVQAFGGRVTLGAIEVERPLGPATAISGGFEFDGLDLQGVTAAFGFGEIEGRLQGHVRDLRLVDGRPVAFDAWLASDPEYRGERRISQRAIDNLSAVGGGPGGAMSRSFLRVFETFRYDAIGLGCRLTQGTCQMRGLEAADGGYLIVRGAGLPRITVKGHASRVNWSSLVNRLLAATSSEGPRVE